MILAKLLAAHVAGDFLLQPDRSIMIRNEKHFRTPYLYVHGAVHFVLAWLASADIKGWWLALSIAAGHIIFDGVKAMLKKNDFRAFLTDQILHILVIVCCWAVFTDARFADYVRMQMQNASLWWIIAGYLTVIFCYSRLIAVATMPWRKDIPADREMLQRAGRWIGVIERILVLTFVLISQFAAIGFLLAAKSVFRFGDLKEGKDKGHTEYVLIGTLLSFGLTLLTGLFLSAMIR